VIEASWRIIVTDLKIDLSAHPTRFLPASAQLHLSKKVNFIFGKNGTGKTTIADELKIQFFELEYTSS
jgi:predicted ATPase